MTKPRQCFIVLRDQFDENGFIPSLVTEGEFGHVPLSGDPTKFQSPWYWGKTFEQAEAFCIKTNRETFGLDETEAANIVASSMARQ